MKVYLAGPITGVEGYEGIFADAAADLRARGHVVLNPVELDGPGDFSHIQVGDPTYNGFLARDIITFLSAHIDGIVALPGWERSNGARTEVAVNVGMGRGVWAYPDLEPIAVRYQLVATSNNERLVVS